MKVATILYHKNILSIYKEAWIKKCVDSIKNQTFKDFLVYELNYGDDNLNLGEKYGITNHKFYNDKFENHAEAMNFLFEKCLEDDIDIVINNNMDDYNEHNRFEIQIDKIGEGYDIVSSNFLQVDIFNRPIKKMIFSNLDIRKEFEKDHNIICHPSVCYSKRFIKENCYISSEIPKEDFNLWKRTVDNYKFYICDDFLLNYRIHQNQITQIDIKKNEIKNNQNTNISINPYYNNRVSKCLCGEPINKIKYNFCQKCNKLY